ncbi:MAG: class I SAM-dependent rRNA methyltransferase [Bauldia sp.]|nr:class I SAM-dependent rRNA methyltransferase [Bauldia sp.]
MPEQRAHVRPDAVLSPLMLTTAGWSDYALLDSGSGEKLERYGRYRIVRPEPQAMWQRRRPAAEWESADAVFTGARDEDADGRWRFRKPLPETWPMEIAGVRFLGRFTAFRHVGVFPEQEPHWSWVSGQLGGADRPLKVLNLFGYTGLASLLAAKAGAAVTHVDASKKSIAWARENQALSGMASAPIRWICDDAMKFVKREERRGNRYDGIILDPPKFGRGPEGETWDIFLQLAEMMRICRTLLSETPRFLILTAYSIRASFVSMHELARETLAGLGGELESGELLLREESGGREEGGGRLLSTSLFTRWSP